MFHGYEIIRFQGIKFAGFTDFRVLWLKGIKVLRYQIIWISGLWGYEVPRFRGILVRVFRFQGFKKMSFGGFQSI
jgi:hypothetical protein